MLLVIRRLSRAGADPLPGVKPPLPARSTFLHMPIHGPGNSRNPPAALIPGFHLNQSPAITPYPVLAKLGEALAQQCLNHPVNLAQRRIQRAGIFPAGFSQVRPPAAFAPDFLRHRTDDLARLHPAGKVLGDAHDQ